jgi:hypothetical protein
MRPPPPRRRRPPHLGPSAIGRGRVDGGVSARTRRSHRELLLLCSEPAATGGNDPSMRFFGSTLWLSLAGVFVRVRTRCKCLQEGLQMGTCRRRVSEAAKGSLLAGYTAPLNRLLIDSSSTPSPPCLLSRGTTPWLNCSSSSWAPRSFPNRAPPTSAADTCRAKRKHGERRKLRPPRAKEGVRRGCARAHRALTRSFEPADAGARGSERALVDSAPDRAPPHHRRQAERPTPWILDAARRERAPPRRGPRRVKRDPGPPTRSEAR